MADISQNPQSNIKPDESNIYIRTMNQDMQNLNQGGGNFSPGLGAQQQPIPNPNQMPSQTPSQTPTSFDQSSLNELKQKIQNINSGASLNQTQNIPINPTSPIAPQMASEPPVPPASAPSLAGAGGLSQNIPPNYQTFYSTPQTPMATPIEPLSSFPPNSPASSQPSQPNDNIMFNPSLSPELSNVPSNIPMQDNQSMGQFNVATEPSLEASSIPTYTKPKTNTKKLLIPIIIIIVLLGFYFLI
ncbi:MAG TPA: hypothetical protein PLH82_01970 [Candidatus Paceibacterota bacterium]|nr:hypothetical protein [Candidatus Paceibacterota bacterium]